MKKINLETCDRQTLRDLGVRYEDVEVGRKAASNLRENWVETHARVDESTLPAGALVLECGAFWGSGCVAVKNGRVVDRAFNGAAPWWDDDISSILVVPEDGEVLHRFGSSMNSFSLCYEDDDEGLWCNSAADWGWGTLLCFHGSLFTSRWLREIGASKDAADVEKAEKAAEKAARRARYEAALERAELLYPYQGGKVFKTHIQWALEEGVAKAAIALADHYRYLQPRLRPLGGWPCHHHRLAPAWRSTYGWTREKELDELLTVCGQLTQPRLDAAWKVAKVLAD